MDADAFAAIAHRDHRYLSPVGRTTMEAVLGLLGLPPGARVVDLGCGKAEALIRLIELYGVDAVGVDRNRRHLAAARERAAAVVPGGGLTLIDGDVADFVAEPGSFDLGLCVGATEALGGLDGALVRLRELVAPGGGALVGVGFWRRPAPDPTYLAFLGIEADALGSHEDNAARCAAAGWDVQRSWTASDEEWDAYEETYLDGVERHALEHPEDEGGPAMLGRARAWHHHYQFYGRFDLGFGLYLLRKR